MNTCLFTNWTDETFNGMWDKQSYEIKSGASIYLEDWKAEHFAKHLVDRELNKLGKSTADPIRDALKAKCFGSVETVTTAGCGTSTDILNKNKVEEPKVEVKEAVKEEKKVDKRTKEYKENKEKFEGLKTNE